MSHPPKEEPAFSEQANHGSVAEGPDDRAITGRQGGGPMTTWAGCRATALEGQVDLFPGLPGWLDRPLWGLGSGYVTLVQRS